MIKKVTIKKVKIVESPFSKDGQPTEKYVYKKGKNIGKNFVMVTIQTNETGDDYYSTPCLPTDKAAQIKEGESHLLSLTESPSADGQKVFKNFNFPTKEQLADLVAASI